VHHRSRQLLVAGHVIVDRYLRVDAMPAADRTVPVTSERTELGGTATNLARTACKLGVRVGILSRIGEGFPPEFRATLARERIDLRGLTSVAGAPTPTCTILEEPGGTTRTLIQQGPMVATSRWPLPGPWWGSYEWLHLCTGDPGYYLRLARAAHANHQRVSIDPAQEIFYRWDARAFRGILPFADLLFGNRAEIERATSWVGPGGPTRLLERIPLVIRTEGGRGATAFSRDGTVHVAGRKPRRVRSYVGAGDAFRGGFYGAWFAGEPLGACLDAGNGAAVSRIEGGV